MSRIKEKTLILPALYIIDRDVNVTMSDLIRELTYLFNPDGEDAEILDGRSDTKFSQKVRNLKSHRETNGMATYTFIQDEIYSLTEAGRTYLNENKTAINYLFTNNFTFNDVATFSDAISAADSSMSVPFFIKEDNIVTEGNAEEKKVKVKTRSPELRDAAIKYYTEKMGALKCYICDFSFEEKYGEHGKGYIEIHHERPVCNYDDKGFSEFLKDAVLFVKPLCSNCHRMIHRNTKKPLTIEELKALIN